MSRALVESARIAVMIGVPVLLGGCRTKAGPTDQRTVAPAGTPSRQRILFIGDSFTHGRYTPVRTYGASGSSSALVVDEDAHASGKAAERSDEPGPWGGIPGIFARFAREKGLDYEVHLEAISATSLEKNFEARRAVIERPGWSAVVLQEMSALPLPASLTPCDPCAPNKTSCLQGDPERFAAGVQRIESAVHRTSPGAKIYLYATWAPADLAAAVSGGTCSAGFCERYPGSLSSLTRAYQKAYLWAAECDGHVAGVAPVGDAWSLAWAEKVAPSNPFPACGATARRSLWYGPDEPANDPHPAKPDNHHPSVHGAYLAALVLFEKITGIDAGSLGPGEQAGRDLGIEPDVAALLQHVAAKAVEEQPATRGDAPAMPACPAMSR